MSDATTGPFSTAEIERAFSAFQSEVARIAGDGDWPGFADLFTTDASYKEHAFGEFRGREEIREWVVRTMTSFPGDTMISFPIAWHVVDEPTSRVICEIRNLMPDPGDGSVHEESNLTILTYAGEGLWSREEDVYNPMNFLSMATRWARAAAAHGTLGPTGVAFLEQVGS